MRVLFLISVIGLVASAIAHFSTFFGINPQRVFPSVWVLHVLIFVVWFPVVISCRKLCTNDNRKDFWKLATRNSPNWMKRLCVIFFVYAFFNFFCAFVLSEGGNPSEIDGRKVLSNHGEIIRELTDEEYDQLQAYEVRGFSGHWLVFYAAGMTVLYSRLRDDSDKPIVTVT